MNNIGNNKACGRCPCCHESIKQNDIIIQWRCELFEMELLSLANIDKDCLIPLRLDICINKNPIIIYQNGVAEMSEEKDAPRVLKEPPNPVDEFYGQVSSKCEDFVAYANKKSAITEALQNKFVQILREKYGVALAGLPAYEVASIVSTIADYLSSNQQLLNVFEIIG